MEVMGLIALKREMPNSCFQCPCMETLYSDASKTEDIKSSYRICKAANMVLVGPAVLTEKDIIPKEWLEFSIPAWCPWNKI